MWAGRVWEDRIKRLKLFIDMRTQADTQVEKSFYLSTVYRRSRKIIDIQQIKDQQKRDQIYRRSPTKSIQTLDTRVDSSFINTTENATQKLEKNIASRRRYEEDPSANNLQYESIASLTMYSQADLPSHTPRKLRAPDFAKMQARKSTLEHQSPSRNETHFNNFEPALKSVTRSIDFSHSPSFRPSQLRRVPRPSESLYRDTSYERNNFNQTVMKCLFDYGKSAKRINKTIEQSPQPISFDRVRKAENFATVNRSPSRHSFYQQTGRHKPSQMDLKLKKPNEFYFVKGAKAGDYSSRNRAQQMQERKIEEVKRRKKCIDNKDEMCDQRFFLRRSFREKRQDI